MDRLQGSPTVPTTSREVLAEFLGTFVLIVFGIGVVAQVILGGGSNGQYLSINIGWGLAVTMAVYVSGGVSGGHLNPAVTIAAAAFRGFPWSKVAAVHRGADRRRLRGVGDRLCHLSRARSRTSTAACGR